MIDTTLLRNRIHATVKRTGAKLIEEATEGLKYRDKVIALGQEVVLDQWFYSAFKVRDSEAADKRNLHAIYTVPAIDTLCRGLDRAIRGRVASLLADPRDFISAAVTGQAYDAGYSQEIAILFADETTLQIDSVIEIAGERYAIIEQEYQNEANQRTIMLDRPLQTAIKQGVDILGGPILNVTCDGVTVVIHFPPVLEQLDVGEGGAQLDSPGTVISIDLLAGILVDINQCRIVDEPVNA